jgi:hypothetical protein
MQDFKASFTNNHLDNNQAMIKLRNLAITDMEPFIAFADTCNINTDTHDFEKFFEDLNTFFKDYKKLGENYEDTHQQYIHKYMCHTLNAVVHKIRKQVQATKKQRDEELIFIHNYFQKMGAFTRFTNDRYE